MRVEAAQVHMMGTVIDIQVEDVRPEPILREAVSRLKLYEHRFSANDPTSELGALNQAAGVRPIKVHPQLFELIELSTAHSLAPGSMLNIAIGPLVQLWRIGFDDAHVPEQSLIDDALILTDPAQIELDASTGEVFLRREGMKLDLGAVAKGYIADLIVDYFSEIGVRSAMINLGGNVLTFGRSPRQEDGLWRVGLRHPKNSADQIVGALSVGEKSVVTSGVYQRQLVRNGRTFHHILDPSTGHPVETDVMSLTIVSDLSVDGEIWTSRLFGRSAPEILRATQAETGLSAVVITEQLDLYASPELRGSLTLSAAQV